MMKKQWIACNSCGADVYRPLSTVGEWTIGKCGDCGLVFLNPAPFFEPTTEFSAMSKGFQYTQYMHQMITPKIFAFETDQLRFQMGQLTELTGRSFQAIRYLEVGCGSGASVRAATDLGWVATGVDLDPELIREGIEQHGSDLRCSPLLKAGLDPGSFDFIRLRDVIEHLPDPYESMLEVHRLLRPGGLCLIVAPNEGGLVNRVRYSLGFKRNLVAYAEPPHHIHGFDPSTLKLILERTGFKVLRLKTTVPFDSNFVTSNNMRTANQLLLVSIWKSAQLMGMGNFLVAWIQKQ